MNKQSYFDLVERELNNIKDVIQRKNNDYTAGNASAFANFEDTGGMCDPLVGLLLRMGDKMQRLRTFAKNGTLQVKGEGAEDAFRDLIGYSLIGLGMVAEASKADSAPSSPSAPVLKVKAGKRYKRRDGKTARVKLNPAAGRDPLAAPFLIYPEDKTEAQGYSCREDGTWAFGDGDHSLDLVEELPE